jgi:PBP1b-binding outer membrane lipoprotein LpoB
MRTSVLLIALLLISVSCRNTKTHRSDINDDSEVMGTGIESADVEAMANLAKKLIDLPELTGPGIADIPRVAIYPLRNETRHDFDSELLVRRLQSELLEHANGRVRFVVRNRQDLAVLETERTKKREGEYTSKEHLVKSGADYYLTGVAQAISSSSGRLESDAIWIFFELRDPERAEVIWSGRYATKKIGKAGVIYR